MSNEEKEFIEKLNKLFSGFDFAKFEKELDEIKEDFVKSINEIADDFINRLKNE